MRGRAPSQPCISQHGTDCWGGCEPAPQGKDGCPEGGQRAWVRLSTRGHRGHSHTKRGHGGQSPGRQGFSSKSDCSGCILGRAVTGFPSCVTRLDPELLRLPLPWHPQRSPPFSSGSGPLLARARRTPALDTSSRLRPTDLEVVRVPVRPRQQHGGKEVPGAHEDCVHLAHLHADALCHHGAVGGPWGEASGSWAPRPSAGRGLAAREPACPPLQRQGAQPAGIPHASQWLPVPSEKVRDWSPGGPQGQGGLGDTMQPEDEGPEHAMMCDGSHGGGGRAGGTVLTH